MKTKREILTENLFKRNKPNEKIYLHGLLNRCLEMKKGDQFYCQNIDIDIVVVLCDNPKEPEDFKIIYNNSK